MGILDLLLGRKGTPPLAAGDLLARVRARAAGAVLPDPEDPEGSRREQELGEQYAVTLHAAAHLPPPLGRRAAAIADAARLGRPRDLAEALHGLSLSDVPALLDAVAARRDVPHARLADVARTLAGRAATFPLLGLCLALLAFSGDPRDAEVLVAAGRSPALAGPCSEALARRGDAASLLALARGAEGIGRALALERLALLDPRGTPRDPAVDDEALRLCGTLKDVATRAYAAVSLLETSGVSTRIATADPGLVEAVTAALEACARGGWNGGPGPGLGRLPRAQDAAEAVLAREDGDPATRRRAAIAVLTASPIVPGALRKKAEELLRKMTT